MQYIYRLSDVQCDKKNAKDSIFDHFRLIMGDDGGHNKDGGFVPRVNQLDAETLDQELVTIFKNGIISSFKYFLR